MTTTTWASRESLSTLLRPSKAEGWLQVPGAGDIAVPLPPDQLTAALDVSAGHLAAAGLRLTDRVVVALNSDGVSAGALLSLAASRVTRAAASAGPRGRMRLLRALKSTGATALVITPTGAMDLLARLHIEFLVDPLDLGIERIVLVGEIPSPACERQLAMEFGAEIGSVLCDPYFGMVVAHRHGTRLVASEDHVVLAPLHEDVVVTRPEPGQAYELVLRPGWAPPLADAHLRTGWVAFEDGDAGDVGGAAGAGGPSGDGAGDGSSDGVRPAGLPWPTATVGDRVLIRGQWVSLQEVTAALRVIDGIDAWSLEVRRDGTLDKAILRVAFDRPSLTENRMWAKRLRESMNQLTPVEIEVDVVTDPAGIGDRLVDHRGHHLGLDRSAVKPSGAA